MATSKKDKKVIFYMNLGVALTIPCLIAAGFVDLRYFTHPLTHIKSLTYVAPRGCAVQRYRTGDVISPACVDPHYFIPHETAKSYDWSLGRADRDYYRVGDDAYQIDCAGFHIGVCTVDLVEYAAFAR